LDRDCELQKIAVFHSYLGTHVNTQYSFLAGGLFGIMILVLTLFYEGAFDVFGGRFLGLIPFAIILVGVFYAFNLMLQSIKDRQTRFLLLVFDLISRVEKGEPIPSLSELNKRMDKKDKVW
jgi:hypothetical protein